MKRIAYSLIALAIAAFTFTSCEDVPSPFGTITDPDNGGGKEVVEPTGSGTAEDPYNVAKVIEVTKALSSEEVVENVYTKGYIVQIDNIDTSGDFGNATYWISDDVDGKSGKYEVYRGFGLGGEKFNAAGATIIKTGDLVIIKGKIKNFKGQTPEYDSGSIIVELNGVKAGDTPTPSGETLGTKENPLTIDQALEKINALADGAESDQFAFVKGKVVKVTTNEENFTKYGNLNYLISVDGTDNGKTITVYSGDGLDGAKFTSINDLAQDDEVIVYGKLYKYVNKSGAVTPEIAKGNYLVSLVKGNGGNTPTPTPSGTGTLDNPLTASQAYDAVAAMTKDVTSTDDYYVKGKICSIKFTFSAEYGTATFNISDDGKTGGKEFTVYGTYYKAAEQKWVEGDTQIAVGDEVVVCGKVVNYGGNTPEFANKKSYVVSINGNGSGAGGGTTSGVQAVSVADFNAAAESTDVWYQLTGTISNLKDGDQYGNFDLTDSTGSVYVYGVLSEKGGAKKKFQELVAQYGIANGKTITIIGNRGSFNGKIEVVNAYFVSVE